MSDDKFKVVLVGCGGISRVWLEPATARDDIEIVGLVDLNPDNIAQKQRDFGLTNVVTGANLSEVIAKTEADIVFDCTVPPAHKAVTLEAIENNCHVLGEKPMCDTLANAQTVLQKVQASDRIYTVTQNYRYKTEPMWFKSNIDSGEIGSLTTLNADFYIGAHFGGFRDEMEHVLLLDMAIHGFDLARYFSGKDPVSVYCHEWNPAGSWYHHGASAMAIFEMSDGVVFNYRGSWCSEGFNTDWNCAWRAIGDKGSLIWDGANDLTGEKIKAGSEGFFVEKESIDVGEKPNPELVSHAGVIDEFIQSLREGKTPQTVCSDNIKSLAMVQAAIESAETQKKIQIEY